MTSTSTPTTPIGSGEPSPLRDRGLSLYRAWKLWIEPERLRLRKRVRRWLSQAPASSVVVEVGAGNGFMEPVVRAAIRDAAYIGGDIAPTNNSDVVFDALAMPFAPASVDVLLAVEVLEHLPEPRSFVDEVARVLKPGGRLIVTVPFMFGVHDYMDYRRFTPLGFEQLVGDQGLTLVETETRGGTFVAATGLVRTLILNALVGTPEDWRANSRAKQVRWLIATVLLTPWTIVTWVAFGLDALFDRRTASPPGYFFLCARDTTA